MTPTDTTTPRAPHRLRRLRRTLLSALLAGGIALTAAPAATAGSTGADRAQATIVTSTGRGGNSVAFTFDDGPGANTPQMLDVLKKNGVKAVFCLWGDHVRQNPDMVRRIVNEGHTLCNHSMQHQDMGGWSADQVRQNLEQTNNAIRQAVPNAQIPYYRAPYGSWGQSADVAASMGMTPLGWRADIADWQPPGADALTQRLRQAITPGAVVLMHDGGGDRSQTVTAVDRVIPEFKGQGWSFDLPARQ
ncbi:polysaccharide deacetylase family protein [Streptomyces xinghaiensis]|uniref:polysaccharide deacetylase family protein n=1 Tax=Streptomyces xinghaiensis TaxID=1038928 RepID=UPI002E0DBABD|nr:polysaccharide deacetylase family protein [Streptomyces xinghaiensis]